MRFHQLFSVTATFLCSAVIVLVQPSSSEAAHVYEALFARAFFFGKDTSDPLAIDLDIFQQPKNHPTATASILLNAAFAASFEPKDGVITDPEAFSEFEAQVSRISALKLGRVQKKTMSLTEDYHQLACEISKQYDSQHAVTVATAFRGLIPRFAAENPWRNLLLVVMFIDRDDVTEHITVEMVSVAVTITKNFDGHSIISRQQAALTQKAFHVDADDLVYNAEKWKESVYIHDVDHFLERMSSAKNPDRPDDDDRPSTCDGIFKGIQDFFSGIDGIFEGIRDFLVGIIRLSTSIPESIAKFFSKIFKSIGGLFTFLRDLISKGFHAFMDFFSETVFTFLRDLTSRNFHAFTGFFPETISASHRDLTSKDFHGFMDFFPETVFTFPSDLISKSLHTSMIFISEIVTSLLICAMRLLPYVFGWHLVGGLALPLTIFCLIVALGFTATGIIKGSAAAYLMSWFHPIAAGGLIATLQSLGALGLCTKFYFIIIVIGVVAGGMYDINLG